MAKVKLQVISWLSRAFVATEVNRYDVELEVAEEETVGALFDRLAAENKVFADYVFDRSTQNLTGRVSVFFNNRMLELVQGLDTEMKDGDFILIVPAYSGG
ncbi:MAG: hypothetical protein HW388_547 [Dehalococcoidia bacterium]|nr:hypothetical protein [Dehalococcoidia bacterium]